MSSSFPLLLKFIWWTVAQSDAIASVVHLFHKIRNPLSYVIDGTIIPEVDLLIP